MTAVIVDHSSVRLYDERVEAMREDSYKKGYVAVFHKDANMTNSDFINRVLVYAEDYDNNEYKKWENYRMLLEAFDQRNG